MRRKKFQLKDKVISLLLTFCMILTLMPMDSLVVYAETVEYWVGDTTLTLTENKEDGNWKWDSTERTLTFTGKNVILISNGKDCLRLPAGAKIVMDDGSYAEIKAVSTESASAAGLYCAGDLSITGNGGLVVYSQVAGENGKSSVVCEGQLVVGDDKTTPYVFVALADSVKSDKVLYIKTDTGEKNPIILNSGYLYMEGGDTDKRGIFVTGNNKTVQINSQAVLRDADSAGGTYNQEKGGWEFANCFIKCAKKDGIFFCGTDGVYNLVEYTGTLNKQIPLKCLIGSYADLTVSSRTDSRLAGWNTKENTTTVLSNYIIPKLESGDVIKLYPVYVDGNEVALTTPNASLDYATGKLTGLVPGAKYEIAIGDVTKGPVTNGEFSVDLSVDSGKTIKIKEVPADGAKALNNKNLTESAEQEIKILGVEATPNATINYANKTIDGLKAGKYKITVNGESSASFELNLEADGSSGEISNFSSYEGKTLSIVKLGKEGETRDSAPYDITVKKSVSAPGENDFTITQATDTAKAIITVPSAGAYEYKKADNTWEQIIGTTLETEAYTTVSIRKKETDTEQASAPREVKTKAAQPTNASINYALPGIGGLTSGTYIVKHGNDVITTAEAEGDGTIKIEGLFSYKGQTLSVIRKSATSDSAYDSEPYTFTVNNNVADAPAKTAFTFTYGDDKVTVNGVANTYEYRVNGQESWTTGTDAGIALASGQTIEIRKKADKDNWASETLTIKLEETPKATVNYKDGKITGLESGKDYKIDGVDQTFKAETDGTISLNLSAYYGKDISITKQAQEPDLNSIAQKLPVIAPKDAPSGVAVAKEATDTEQAVISGLNAGMEYSTDDGKSWKAVSDNWDASKKTMNVNADMKIFIRVAATADAPASEYETISTKAAQPTNAKADCALPGITGLTPKAEYIVKSGENKVAAIKADDNGAIIISNLESYAGKELSVIRKSVQNMSKCDSQAQPVSVTAAKEAQPSKTAFPSKKENGRTYVTRISAEYAYQINDGEWLNGNGSDVEISGGQTIKIRKNATETKWASEPIEMKMEETPTAKINYSLSALTGFVEGGNYKITVVDSNGTETVLYENKSADADGISVDLPDCYGKKLEVIKLGDIPSEAQGIPVSNKAGKPGYDVLGMDAPTGSETQITIPRIPEGYEYWKYKDSTEEESWQSGPVENVLLEKGETIEIREKATDDAPESEILEITTKEREQTPDAKVNYAKEELTGLENGVAYKVEVIGADGTVKAAYDDLKADENGEILLLKGTITSNLGNTVEVTRKTSDPNKADSLPQPITLKTALDAPAKEFTVADAKGGSDKAVISGVDDTMEYRVDGEEEWTKVGAGQTTIEMKAGESAQTVEIRVAATDELPASEAAEVTVAAAQKPEEKPVGAKADYELPGIAGLVPGEVYIITEEDKEPKEFTADENGKIKIEELFSSREISVVKKGKENTYNSDAQILTIAVKEAEQTPDAKVNYAKEKLTGLEEGASYKVQIIKDGTVTATYDDLKADENKEIILPEGTVKLNLGNAIKVIRKAGSVLKEDSDPQTITLKTAPDTPANEFTVADAKGGSDKAVISGVDDTMEYRVDGKEEWTKVGAGQTTIEMKAGESAQTVEIRVAATDELPASKTARVNVAAAQKPEEKPVGAQADYELPGIAGLVPGEVYIITEEDKEPREFTADENGKIKIEEMFSSREISVVKKGKENTYDSDAQILAIAAKEKEQTPDAKVNYAKENLTGLNPSTVYEIEILENGTVKAAYDDVKADENGAYAFSKGTVTSNLGNTIRIIAKAGGVMKEDSDPQTITLKTALDAPAKEFTVADAKGGSDKAVISGVDDTMEYRLDGAKEWTKVGEGQTTIEIQAGESAQTVEIRVAATDELPASKTARVNVAAAQKPEAEAVPVAKLDYAAGKITDLISDAVYAITADGKTDIIKADAEGKIDLTAYYGKTISIVKKGIENVTTDSGEQTLKVSAVTQAPSEDQFVLEPQGDGANVVVNNISSEYEYSLDNGVTWQTGNGSVTVPAGTVIMIRIRATADAPASSAVTIRITNYAMVAAVDQMILNTNTDTGDVEGSTFAPICLKATGKNKSIKLTWKKVNHASGYILYGSACGKNNKMQKLVVMDGSKKNCTVNKLKASKYYKFMVVAYQTIDGKDYVVSISKVTHATPKQNTKYGNPKKIKVNVAKISLKRGKKKTIKAKLTITKAKMRRHIAKFRYESTDTSIVTVTKKGVVKGIKKGTAYVYVYAQNGVYKRIKVTVN